MAEADRWANVPVPHIVLESTRHEDPVLPTPSSQETLPQLCYQPPLTLHEFVGAEAITFYRPPMAQMCDDHPTMLFAIRCNENYANFKACILGERPYVRNMIVRAGKLFFYKSAGGQPIVIGTDFQAPIRNGNQRLIDSALARCLTVKPAKAHRIEIDPVKLGFYQSTRLVRAQGSTAALRSFMDTEGVRGPVKETFMKNISVLHFFVQSDSAINFSQYFGCLTFEYVTNIIGSEMSARQGTLRFKEKLCPPERLLETTELLQNQGCTVTIKSQTTIRFTANDNITAALLKNLETSYPEWTCFSDDPIAGYTNSTRTRTTPSQPRHPRTPQTTIVKICADHIVHDEIFTILAQSLGGGMLKLLVSKYNDVPLAALIRVPTSEVEKLVEAPITVDGEGLFYITRCRHRSPDREIPDDA